jgi:hypothetical protein
MSIFQSSRPARIAAVSGFLEHASLQLRVAKRLATRRGGSLSERLGRLNDRLVFVVGSPRSGTTFLAGALGSLPGFVDLGEVAPLKAAVADLVELQPDEAARRLRRLLAISRRVGLVGSIRPVEQTPEVAFIVEAVALTYPDARIVHLVRDGRDVVCSLLEKGWLSTNRSGEDDAGIAFGPYPRFWVEAERRDEFVTTSDARRAAWAWRRYVIAARSEPDSVFELRYERLAEDHSAASAELAAHIGVAPEQVETALRPVRASSVGRYRRDLSAEQLDDVIAEAGGLLRELGYVT